MSRWIEELPDGTYHEEIENMDECRWMYNEVCCNDQSPHVGDWPWKDDCSVCLLFEKEEK